MTAAFELPKVIRTPKTLALLCATRSSTGDIDVDQLHRIARALMRGGNPRQAQVVLRGAIAKAVHLGAPRETAERLTEIAEDLVRLRHPRKARRLLLLAESAANRVEWIDSKETVLTGIAIAYAKAGYPHQAIPLADQLKDRDCKWWAQRSIIAALADADQVARALSISARLRTDAAKGWAWSRIALAVAKTGDTHLAREFFQRALVFASQVVKVTWYDGDARPPADLKALLEGDEMPGQGSIFIGTNGVMLLPHIARPQLYPESTFNGFRPPRIESHHHWLQFVEACRGNGATAAGFNYSGPLTEAVLLGGVATHFPKTTLQWNVRKLQFDLAEANSLLRRTYRKGWEVPGLS